MQIVLEQLKHANIQEYEGQTASLFLQSLVMHNWNTWHLKYGNYNYKIPVLSLCHKTGTIKVPGGLLFWLEKNGNVSYFQIESSKRLKISNQNETSLFQEFSEISEPLTHSKSEPLALDCVWAPFYTMLRWLSTCMNHRIIES